MVDPGLPYRMRQSQEDGLRSVLALLDYVAMRARSEPRPVFRIGLRSPKRLQFTPRKEGQTR